MNASIRKVAIAGLKWALLLAVSSVVTMPPGFAQDAVEPWVEYHKHVEGAEHIAALEEGFSGDSVSLYDGATTFSVADISVPGNSKLPVQLVRRLAIELRVQGLGPSDPRLLGAGNWDVDVPYITATYPSPNAYPGSPGWQAQRCSGRSSPDLSLPPPFWDSDVWSGINIHIPGRGDAKALGMNASVPKPTSGGPYYLTTSARDALDCIPMQSGLSGEGFRLTTTSGVQYDFDVGVTRVASTLKKWWSDAGQARYLNRYQYYLLASKITDRYGNWVQFQYNAAWHPTRIWSSDGREIDLTYSGDRLASAMTNGRTWQYQYDAGGNLTGVTLPDASRWQYTYSGSLTPPMPPPGESFINKLCQIPPALIDDTYTLTATGPSGATASFQFQNTRHYRSGVVVNECINIGQPTSPIWYLRTPYFFDVMSLTQKTISGPGITTATWSYVYAATPAHLWGTVNGYNPYPCTTCRLDKTNTVTEPDGTQRRYRFGVEYALNDGRQLETDTVLGDGSTVVRTQTDEYLSESAVASQPFYPQYGDVLDGVGDPLTARIRPVINTVITQDGATFTTTTNTFDTFARATKQTESSTLGNPHYTRIDQTTYSDNTSLWVLGQVATSTVAGVVAAQTTYTSKAQPFKSYRFGKLISTNAWNLDGTLVSVTDGDNHATTLSSWYRGVPRTITYADGTHQSAVVNGDGWITSVTDENGFTTNYGYDAMGRLASITYPTADDVAWNQTLLSFAKVSASEYGIPAGHWKQVVHTGNGYAVTYFDAMWRPLVSERYDSGNKAATLSQTVTRYDAMGRTIFASYPANNITSYATANTGADTSYDALGRVAQVKQDSELGTLTTTTAYQSGFETKFTDPRGNSTVTSYQAFGEPTTDFPDSVTAPDGELTVIMRDVFGKPESITRTGTAAGSPQFTRNYVYDSHRQLCKRVDPETGATAFGYDGAGNIIWSAAGLNLPNAGSCDATAAAASSRRVNRTYDTRNRLATLSFPDGFGNQTWTYTPDGLPAQITTAGSGQNVVNSYVYDKRRLLAHEDLIGRTGWATWRIIYGYDANGHLASESLPIGAWTYAPDALGRPTQLALSGGGTYISGVQYAPDGTVKQFTRANGIVRTVTKNTRLLPSRIVDTGGGVTPIDQRYTYNKDASPTAITDYGNSAQNRTMTYDALDRLAGMNAASMGGQYNYSYDVLDNLRTLAHVGGSTSTYNYDSNNRLSSIVNTANGTRSYAWDVQGNLVNSAGKVYHFSYGNRLKDVAATQSYRYDGWGRRLDAYDETLQASLRSIYTRSGQLAFQQDYRGGTKFHTFQYLGGQLAVVVDYYASHAINGVRYPHTDAQGTIVAYTNSSRTILSRSVYDTWGTPRDHGNDDAPGYTGHFQDALTGLTYMQQRYYDPVLSRFISADPVGVDEASGANFNRYWYAKDNPYRYTDPDGRQIAPVVAACAVTPGCKALVVAGAVALGVAAKKAGDAAANYYDHVMQSQQSKATSPALPKGLVGVQDAKSGQKGHDKTHDSGPLAPTHGGTGDAESDFGKLTGGQSAPAAAGKGYPPGTTVGENGISIRPAKGDKGPRIDIPANGNKPPETLHYPKPPPPPPKIDGGN